MWRIEQVTHLAQFEHYRLGISRLLACYHSVLMDASCGTDPAVLVENLAGSLPLLWVLSGPLTDARGDESGGVYGIASLTDVVLKRHAFLHGVSHPSLASLLWALYPQKHDRQSLITRTAQAAIAYAFHELEVLKVKAEFEADNAGARGFCMRMGFTREGHFKLDNRVNGVLKDVWVYSLSRDRASRHLSV